MDEDVLKDRKERLVESFSIQDALKAAQRECDDPAMLARFEDLIKLNQDHTINLALKVPGVPSNDAYAFYVDTLEDFYHVEAQDEQDQDDDQDDDQDEQEQGDDQDEQEQDDDGDDISDGNGSYREAIPDSDDGASNASNGDRTTIDRVLDDSDAGASDSNDSAGEGLGRNDATGEDDNVDESSSQLSSQELEPEPVLLTIEDGVLPMVLALPSCSEIPIDRYEAMEEQYLLRYEKETEGGLEDARHFLFAGKRDVHSLYLVFLTDIFLGDKSPSTIEQAVKSLGLQLDTSMQVLEAIAKKESASMAVKYARIDPTKPLMNIMSELEKQSAAAAAAEDSQPSAVIVAAEVAYNSAGLTGKGFRKESGFSKEVTHVTSFIASNASAFRVLGLITVSDLEKYAKSKAKKRLIVQLKRLATDIIGASETDIGAYTLLLIYDKVLVPAAHSKMHHFRAHQVCVFLCESIQDRHFINKWYVVERIAMTATLEEEGGEDAILARIGEEEAALGDGQSFISSFFGEVNLAAGKNKFKTANARRKKASLSVFLPLAGSTVVAANVARQFVFSLLHNPLSSYTIYRKRNCNGFDILLDEDLHRGVPHPSLQSEAQAILEEIVSKRAACCLENVNYQDMRGLDDAEARERKIETIRAHVDFASATRSFS